MYNIYIDGVSTGFTADNEDINNIISGKFFDELRELWSIPSDHHTTYNVTLDSKNLICYIDNKEIT